MQKCIPIHRARILHRCKTASQTHSSTSVHFEAICKNPLDQTSCLLHQQHWQPVDASRSTFVNLIVRAHRRYRSVSGDYLLTLFHKIPNNQESNPIVRLPLPLASHICRLLFERSAPAVVKCESVGLFKHMYTPKASQKQKERNKKITSKQLIALYAETSIPVRPLSWCKTLKLWKL